MQTLAAYRREESIVAQEAVAVAAQIRTLEAQLRALKSRHTELEDRKAQLQQQSRVVGDSWSGSTKGAAVRDMGCVVFAKRLEKNRPKL